MVKRSEGNFWLIGESPIWLPPSSTTFNIVAAVDVTSMRFRCLSTMIDWLAQSNRRVMSVKKKRSSRITDLWRFFWQLIQEPWFSSYFDILEWQESKNNDTLYPINFYRLSITFLLRGTRKKLPPSIAAFFHYNAILVCSTRMNKSSLIIVFLTSSQSMSIEHFLS